MGPCLFNCVPAHLRTLDITFERFKVGVDKWLQGIPDLPWSQHQYHPAKDHKGLISNSIRAWVTVPARDLPALIPACPGLGVHGPPAPPPGPPAGRAPPACDRPPVYE